MPKYYLLTQKGGTYMAKLSIAHLESLTIKEIYALAKEHKITY
ncbi:hypothetical protein, partial [Listeria monocytogenes]